MTSLILFIAAKIFLPLLLVFSLYLLIRGHNAPGGGFVGGLMASSALAFYVIARGVEAARLLLRTDPRNMIGFGLAIALLSGLISFVAGEPLMTGQWFTAQIPLIGKVGTPLLFDVGVYVVVIGVTLTIVFTLAEEIQE